MKYFKLNASPSTTAKIWILTFDTPGEKVNKLGVEVTAEFQELTLKLAELGKSGELEALMLVSGKEKNFIAGADIEMIRAAETEEAAREISDIAHRAADAFENLPFPKIAVIDGAALGGGFELALACGTIIMSDDPAARVGLPEVQLGLIPGMGGCVRLPIKVGLATSLDLILTGKTLTGERAFKAGIIEAVLPKQNFADTALKWVEKNLKSLQEGKRLAREPKLGGMGGIAGSALENNPFGRAFVLKQAKSGVMSKTKGNYPSPLAALDLIKKNGTHYGQNLCTRAREEAMKREAQAFAKLASGDVSKNLIQIFFLTEAVKKSSGLTDGKKVNVSSVVSGAVLGAGVMGGGIAQLFAEKNVHTRMKDLTQPALALGVQAASRIFKKQVEKKKINKRQYQQKMNLIAPVTDYSGFHQAQVVVEAIVENMDVKKKVLSELEGSIALTTVIASNTSSLSISKMQTALKEPSRFVGMHFFNPVHRMPLVEVIRGDKSSDEAVATIFQFSKQLGKMPIVVKDAPGFLVNRLLLPYLNEATYLLMDGAPIDEVDRVMLKFGMPMGPMELIDEVGIDVGDKVAHILNDAFGDRAKPAPLNSKVVVAKRLGKKNGKGMYEYDAQGRNKTLNKEIYKILEVTPNSGAVSDEEILDRCILPMINEASRCLEEQVVTSAQDVDLGMIMGTGFPPFRGGLLKYADTMGPQKVVEKLEKYAQRFGARFEPAPAMRERAKNGKLFY